MNVVGIVGGIASGKSLVAQVFAQLGAALIDADRLGHQALRDPAVRDQLTARWGNGILDEQGQIVRAKVAQMVFAPGDEGQRERAFLESVTHPHIHAAMREQISELAARGAVDVVVLDAALLIEAGWDELCDEIVYVDVPQAERLRRALSRGWTEANFHAREASQLPLDKKKGRATLVIDNSNSPEATSRQVRSFWNRLNNSASESETPLDATIAQHE